MYIIYLKRGDIIYVVPIFMKPDKEIGFLICTDIEDTNRLDGVLIDNVDELEDIYYDDDRILQYFLHKKYIKGG